MEGRFGYFTQLGWNGKGGFACGSMHMLWGLSLKQVSTAKLDLLILLIVYVPCRNGGLLLGQVEQSPRTCTFEKSGKILEYPLYSIF